MPIMLLTQGTWIIARPATYIIDQDRSVLRGSPLTLRFGDRTGTDEILTELKKL